MQLLIPLSGRGKMFLGLALLLLLMGAGAFFFLGNGARTGDPRLAHLDGLVRVLENYHARNGFYPQPAARTETLEGMRHVWGYRSQEASLASCTMFQKEGEVNAEQSTCGGDVYDSEGNVIGWKGTLALESAANSVENAGREGRLVAPLGDMLNVLPLDPAHSAFSDLSKQGFGEYVYAVRMPEDGARAKGGVQYQIAATVKDPATGELRTVIRGNYFVRSEERETLPPSLIGPGMLLDDEGELLSSLPLHVLLDGQIRGYPNPVLGEGEDVLRTLSLRGKTDVLQGVIERRQALLPELPEGASREHLTEALAPLEEQATLLLAELAKSDAEPLLGEHLARLEGETEELAQNLELALTTYMREKAEEADSALLGERDHRDEHVKALSGALLSLLSLEKDALFARDEILKYLDGEGIEEQARNRAGRKMESALAGIPTLSLPHPFLTEEAEKAVQALEEVEGVSRVSDSQALTGSARSLPLQEAFTPSVFLLTVSQELSVLLRELRDILRDIQEDLQNSSVPMEELDDAMRRLSRALHTEIERISGLLGSLAPADALPALQMTFQSERSQGEAHALRELATAMRLHGDFAPLLFSRENLADIVLLRQAGVPDLSARKRPEEAEYQGIPYPLP